MPAWLLYPWERHFVEFSLRIKSAFASYTNSFVVDLKKSLYEIIYNGFLWLDKRSNTTNHCKHEITKFFVVQFTFVVFVIYAMETSVALLAQCTFTRKENSVKCF